MNRECPRHQPVSAMIDHQGAGTGLLCKARYRSHAAVKLAVISDLSPIENPEQTVP